MKHFDVTHTHLIAFLAGGLCGIICLIATATNDAHKLRTEAATLGHAQWTVSTNGDVTFKWKE